MAKGGRKGLTPAELEQQRIGANRHAAESSFWAFRSNPGVAWWQRPANELSLPDLLLRPIMSEFSLATRPGTTFAGGSGFGAIDPASRTVFLNPAAPGHLGYEAWDYVLAHLAAHLGFGHHLAGGDVATRAAQEVVADTFVRALGITEPPEGYTLPADEGDDVERLAGRFRRGEPFSRTTMAGPSAPCYLPGDEYGLDFERRLAEGLEAVVAQRAARLRPTSSRSGVAEEARRHILNHYPLLASMAQRITIVTDRIAVAREGIDLAAVNPRLGEIYLADDNLSLREAIFSLAHELLHLGLRHADRVNGRDPFLWNVACDYVINGWLASMAVGTMPQRGLLFDPALAGKSADEIYDLVAAQPARRRRIRTFRGVNAGDIILAGPRTVLRGDVTTLDDIYAGALRYGLDAHRLRYGTTRGNLPEGLEEEINTLDMEPVPWDVALAHWFEEFVPSPVPVRTYARASRRQASTPDIPRPRYWLPEDRVRTATFGVVLDTSGSMDRQMLAMALGAIAAYADERGVRHVRLVYCDAAPYDEGYVSPDDLRRRVAVKGRGGTVLQPAIDMLDAVGDFPPDAPVLVLTDGLFEEGLAVRRNHAWVIPTADHVAPFRADGWPVFRVL